MDKIKNQLAGVAALLGVIAAIGGGFVKYGEIVTKLDALEGASGGKDWSAEIAVLEEKVNALENQDLSHSHDMPKHSHEVGEHQHDEHGHTKILVNEKTIQILQNQIDELKAKSDNPLAQ
ncbi:hypothetical protein HTVC023P_gp48 [Pelagibacter phage HTVC023P]|nr:hypothetical protein HTVC023P_gp48 [Pelagibacter phage HTVC023P]